MSSLPAYVRIAERIVADWLTQTDLNRRQKLPTQEELAKRYNVSRSTIVRALSRLVAEGYIHSQQGSGAYIAKSPPRGGAIRYLSLVVPRLHAPVVVAACRGVERRARHLGYQILLASSDFSVAAEQNAIQQHLRAGAQGVVLYPVTRREEDLSRDYLLQLTQEIPMVALDLGYDQWACSRVQFDNYRLGYEMTQRLLQHGHRRIAFVHLSPDFLHTSIHERRQGWKDAMQEAGAHVPNSYLNWPLPLTEVMHSLHLEHDYVEIVKSLLALQPRPDAVIAWNDDMAVHLIEALIEWGVNAPEEIRIAGFDSEPQVPRLFRNMFPTSRPDFVRLGEMAVEILADQLEAAKPPRTYYYPVPVVWHQPPRAGTLSAASLPTEEAVVETGLLPARAETN